MSNETFAWVIYGAATLSELVLVVVKISKVKRLYAGSAVLLVLAMAHAALLVSLPVFFVGPFFVIGLYRLLNVMRYTYGRMHDRYLYRVVRRSSLYLLFAQAVVATSYKLISHGHVSFRQGLTVLSCLQLFAATLALVSIVVQLVKSRVPLPHSFLSDHELPTLTVAIPARNETVDLEACLKSVIASNYAKLEILVLDDCSQDRTSDIIKQFAHDGVRFIRGTEPGDTWLPKNAAYNTLAHEASSELILFCGVDVRLAPDTLKNLVTYFVDSKLDMVSILPTRSQNAPLSSVAQQVRYLWELAMPRLAGHRPPVLSTSWLMNTASLKKLGGLAAVKRAVVPEAYFARELHKQHKYQFIRANNNFMIESTKNAQAQRDTALRVRYPQVHRRPELVLAITVTEITLILFAVPAGLVARHHHFLTATVVASVSVCMYALSVLIMACALTKRRRLQHFIQGLMVVFVDLWLVNYSMYLYEFDEIRWKERNVCLPVMHVLPSLPKIN